MRGEREITPFLVIENLTKHYSGNADNILENLNLTVSKNEFLCILGPSGCGKTTLLRCLGGFEKYQGKIEIEDEVVQEPGIDRMMVFQDFNQLFPWKTVEQNVQYPMIKNGIKDKKALKEKALRYIDKVGLKGYAEYYPHQLSGGMKQRVAIAKALVLKPKLILMDEPFASLDAMTRRKLQREFLTLTEEENLNVVFITHNIQEAITLGTRIIVMSKKGNIKTDRVNLLQRPITPSTEGYVEFWKIFNEALEEEGTDE